MKHAWRITGAGAATITAVALLVILSCSSSPPDPRGSDLDPAIGLFLDGEYDHAIAAFTILLETVDSDESRREIYYYLGRCYLEMGEVREAIDAFATGVALGDHGPCAEYLARILPAIEGTPYSVSRMLDVRRVQLASLVIRWLEANPDGFDNDKADEPLSMLAATGWMPRTADGGLHGNAVVTRAGFYVFVSRMCADISCSRTVTEVLGRYPRSDDPMPGTEIVAMLGRLIPWKFPDGG